MEISWSVLHIIVANDSPEEDEDVCVDLVKNPTITFPPGAYFLYVEGKKEGKPVLVSRALFSEVIFQPDFSQTQYSDEKKSRMVREHWILGITQTGKMRAVPGNSPIQYVPKECTELFFNISDIREKPRQPSLLETTGKELIPFLRDHFYCDTNTKMGFQNCHVAAGISHFDKSKDTSRKNRIFCSRSHRYSCSRRVLHVGTNSSTTGHCKEQQHKKNEKSLTEKRSLHHHKPPLLD